jgi:hypothetical protein
MNKLIILKMVLGLVLNITIVNAQTLTLPKSGNNQKALVSQWMGPVEVTFIYNSPDVTGPEGESRSGKIWGQLVPYGMNNLGFGTARESPWRAGANENTVFEVSHDILIEGKKLPAGKYGFFVIVEENGPWTLIFSNNTESWGSYFYDPLEDVLRVNATPVESEYREWLTYGFEDRQPNSCVAYLQWENKKLPFRIDVDAIENVYLGIIRNELRGSKGFSWENWNAAANFCLQQKTNLEEALTWAEKSISDPFFGNRSFSTLQTKAALLTALNRPTEGKAIIQQAIELPGTTAQQIHFYGRSLLSEGNTEDAMKIFQFNYKKHPKDFTSTVGLARGYTALGDQKKAIQYWEKAIRILPENQKQFLPQYEAELNKCNR